VTAIAKERQHSRRHSEAILSSRVDPPSDNRRKQARPGQGPLLRAEPVNPIDERLRQAFPIGEAPEPVIGHPLNAQTCARVLRYFCYPLWVSNSSGRLRVSIGEPPSYGNAEALRLINRVLLWIMRHEDQFIRDAPWIGVPVRDWEPMYGRGCRP
jgi:hypothetical protein